MKRVFLTALAAALGACSPAPTTSKTETPSKPAASGAPETSAAPAAKSASKRTVCGAIVDGKTSRYLCDVEENRQGTTVLRMPDTTLKLTWNLGSTSVQVVQDNGAPVVVKYAEAEGETNFRLGQRTLFYISNPSMAEWEVKNFRQ